MASAQGQAFEDVEASGNKWTLSGYRAVEAQTLSSTLLAAQKQMLKQKDFAADPDEYRATVMGRLEQQLEGLEPRLARMVTEQFSAGIPALVASHTSAHLAYEQQQASATVRRSMDIMSMDDAHLADFVAVADGTGGSSGLSVEARTAAVTNGVVDAFSNGNPQAYAKLKSAGVLSSFSPEQQKLMEKAAKGLDKKQRGTFIQGLEDGKMALEADRDAGHYVDSPELYVADLTTLYTDHGMLLSGNEGREAYLAANKANEYYEEGTALLVRESVLRGDYTAAANITEQHMLRLEEAGLEATADVVGEPGAYQAVPDTVLAPGFGITPADPLSPAEVAGNAREFYRAVMGGNESDIRWNWEPADLEAGMIAFKEGPDAANAFIDAGRDYSVLAQGKGTQEYVEKFLKISLGEEQGTSHAAGKDRTAIAAERLKATQERINVAAHAQFTVDQQHLDDLADSGSITPEEWQERSFELLRKRGEAVSEAEVTKVLNRTHELIKTGDKRVTEDRREVLDAAVNKVQTNLTSILEDPSISGDAKEKAAADALAAIELAYAKEGVTLADYGYAATQDAVDKELTKGLMKSHEYSIDTATIERAKQMGTADSLDADLQERLFTEANADIVSRTKKRVVSGEITEEAGEAIVIGEKMAMWQQIGMIEPQAVAEFTSMMSGPMEAGDGRPSPRVLSAVATYQQFKENFDSPLYKEMMSEKARTQAELILDATGPTGSIADGMQALSMEKYTGAVYSNQKLDREMQAEAAEAAADDILSRGHKGFWGELFGANNVHLDQEQATLESEANRKVVSDMIQDEYGRLEQLQPGYNPDRYMSMALDNVKGRVSAMGNTVIEMDRGYGVRTQMFGKEANSFDVAGIEDTAILMYIRDVVAVQPGFEDIGAITSGESFEAMAKWLIPGAQILPGIDDDGLSSADIDRIQERGVRPITYMTNGKQLVAGVMGPDGELLHRIPIPLDKVGAHFMEQHKDELTR
tara:strand:- start:770 stop:3721 length:2952 start_codon:yes stop_codon:yes gene_type:complete